MTTPEPAAILTDAQLLHLYHMGVGSGAASTLLALGLPEAQALAQARGLIKRMMADPASRHEVLTNARAQLEGRPTPPHTILRGAR